MRCVTFAAVAAIGTLGLSGIAGAVPTPLQNATAVFSQGGFPVQNVIDADLNSGWADGGSGGAGDTAPNTGVFETVNDTASGPGLGATNFVLTTDSGNFGTHTLGAFRFSATTDSRADFADGLASGGDVTANWTVITPASITSTGATTTFTIRPDGSILAGGTASERETYTINGSVPLTGITGLRLELFEDPSLPGSGPGRGPTNGNYVLFNLTADATAVVPEPAALGLLSLGGLLALRRTCRRA